MNRTVPLVTSLCLAGAMLAVAGPQDDVKAAAQKLAAAPSYAWKTTVETPDGGGGGGGGGRFRIGPTEGKTEKDGLTHLRLTRGENTTEAVMKGTKGVVKTEEGWRTATELADSAPAGGGGQGAPNPGRMIARTVQNFRVPAVEAENLAAKVSDLKKTDDSFSGDLPEATVKELLSFGGRPGGNAPEISGAKGSVKFWVKDGVLAKYQYKVQGKVTGNNGNARDVDRTTTVEIKDVGATKVEVPEDARKKLS